MIKKIISCILLGIFLASIAATASTIPSYYYFLYPDIYNPNRPTRLTPEELCTLEVMSKKYSAPAYVVSLEYFASANPYCKVLWNFSPPFAGDTRESIWPIWTATDNIVDTRIGLTGNFGTRDLSCPVGNPVMPGSGIKLQDEIDYPGAGGSPLSLKRLYRSGYSMAPQGGFGSLWMHQYQIRLDLQRRQGGYPLISALRENGESAQFTSSAGSWVATDGRRDSLDPVLDANSAITGWRYRDSGSDRIENYDRSGKLESIVERTG